MISADDPLYSKFKVIEVTNPGLLQSIGQDYFQVSFEGNVYSGAQFYLAPADQSMEMEPIIGGSCTALLQHLLSLNGSEFTPEKLNTNPGVIQKPATPIGQNRSSQLILSLGSGSTFCLFPAHDFALVLLNGQIYACTVSDVDNERFFFTIQFRNDIIDDEVVSCLKSFMTNPLLALQQQQEQSETAAKKSSIHNSPVIKERRCLNCFCSSTPMWRRGPDGAASLCNACGVKWKSGKLVMDQATIEENSRKIKLELSALEQF